MLRRITPLFDTASPDHITVRTAMWVATAGLMRTGEVAVDDPLKPDPFKLLTMRSVRVLQHKPLVYAVHLRASKTDPFRREVDLPITNRTAVELLQQYIATRQADGTNEQHQPLFRMVEGTPLSRKTLLATTGALVSQAGVDMSGHKGFSFRRGGATALQDARVEDRLIKLAGRWRSNAYARYIDTNLPTLLAHMQSL